MFDQAVSGRGLFIYFIKLPPDCTRVAWHESFRVPGREDIFRRRIFVIKRVSKRESIAYIRREKKAHAHLCNRKVAVLYRSVVRFPPAYLQKLTLAFCDTFFVHTHRSFLPFIIASVPLHLIDPLHAWLAYIGRYDTVTFSPYQRVIVHSSYPPVKDHFLVRRAQLLKGRNALVWGV